MAEHGAHDYTRGEMIIEEHERTYEGFMKLSKWGSLAIAAGVLFFTLLFCTTFGFMGAAACTFVLVAVGILVLKENHKV